MLRQWNRFLTWPLLVLAALALRFPYYAFLTDYSNLAGVQPWDNSFKTWCVWDCRHYSRLGSGYTVDDVVYFPGFPWSIIGLRKVLPWLSDSAATLLASNLFSIAAIVAFLILIANIEYGKHWRSAYPWNNKVWLTVGLIAVFPNSHFWSSGYAEGAQALAFALIYLLAYQRRWLAMCAFAGLASLIRIQCCWITAVIGCFVIADAVQAARRQAYRLFGLTRRQSMAALALLTLPFGCFMLWQLVERGDPFLFIHIMSGNGRGFQPLDILKFHVPRYDLNYFLLIFSHVAAWRMVRRPETFWKLLAACTWAIAILPLAFGGFGYGYGRYMTCNLAIFILAGEWLATRPMLAYSVYGWSVFRLAVEISGWTKGCWRG